MSKLVKWRPLMSGFLPSRILTYEKLPRWRKCHRYLKEKTVSASCFFCWRGTLLKSQLAFFQHPPFSSMFKRVFGGNRIGRLCYTEGIGGMEPRGFPVEVFFFCGISLTYLWSTLRFLTLICLANHIGAILRLPHII